MKNFYFAQNSLTVDTQLHSREKWPWCRRC